MSTVTRMDKRPSHLTKGPGKPLGGPQNSGALRGAYGNLIPAPGQNRLFWFSSATRGAPRTNERTGNEQDTNERTNPGPKQTKNEANLQKNEKDQSSIKPVENSHNLPKPDFLMIVIPGVLIFSWEQKLRMWHFFFCYIAQNG